MLHRLLREGDAASGPFSPMTGLSLAGFFFPLLQPMLGMNGHPAIRQQGLQRGGQGVARSGDRATTGIRRVSTRAGPLDSAVFWGSLD